jgi:hypothetical protein
MATRKQLKRERKRRTHGIERSVPDVADREPGERAASSSRPKRTSSKNSGASTGRGRKPVAYPTITRALKRAPILAGIWFILIEFIFKPEGSSTVSNLATTALIAAVMIPAMYMTDRFAYRMALKRGAPVEPPPGGATS